LTSLETTLSHTSPKKKQQDSLEYICKIKMHCRNFYQTTRTK